MIIICINSSKDAVTFCLLWGFTLSTYPIQKMAETRWLHVSSLLGRELTPVSATYIPIFISLKTHKNSWIITHSSAVVIKIIRLSRIPIQIYHRSRIIPYPRIGFTLWQSYPNRFLEPVCKFYEKRNKLLLYSSQSRF